MNERLLQYIWQFQYFNQFALTTTAGDPVQIVFPGHYNSNQGPDFNGARIRTGELLWAGSVELHICTSDWLKHAHEKDPHYENVILHVVWEHDIIVNEVPVLELKDRIPKMLLQRYAQLMLHTSFIPCNDSISTINEIVWDSWKDRLLAERLMRKSALIRTYLSENNFHWEESFWWLLARSFGMNVNADSFESIARSIPVRLLAKHHCQVQQIEAMLLGQAGLLNENFSGEYPQMLQREYHFLKNKYSLETVYERVHFLRMRPGNFPVLRLAQLSMLVTKSTHLFSKIKETASVGEVRKFFDIAANDYWHYHYVLDHPSPYKIKYIGETMIDTLLINTVVPVLFAYGNYYKQESITDKSIKWLNEIPAEKNKITNGFSSRSVSLRTSFDSQAVLELKTQYCDKKRCLDCAIGNQLLKMRC